MNKQLLKDYAELKIQEKELKSKLDTLNESVLEMLVESGVEEVDIEHLGRITMGGRRSWTYPENVSIAESNYKDLKKEAEQLGTATYTEKKYITFRGNGGGEE